VVTEFACRATGGPQHNSGRSMYDSHVHLRLTNKEWTAFMHDLDQSLYKFRVPEAERAEFIALIESAKPDMGLIDAS